MVRRLLASRLAAPLAALCLLAAGASAGPFATPAPGPHGPAGWARGDLHQHSAYSDDGTWEAEALWARIREGFGRGPRFTFLTEHNRLNPWWKPPFLAPREDEWGSWSVARQLRRQLGADEYVGAGQELGGPKGGHIGAVCLPQAAGEDPPHLVRKAGVDHRAWMERIHAAGGLTVVYHPRGVKELGPIHPGSFASWDACLDEIDMISAWNGYKLYDAPDAWAWEKLWDFWLAGRRYVAVGGSDAHQPDPDGEPVGWWGREGKLSFHTHPMNPHNRVRLEGPMGEGTIREGLRAGRVTVADRPENWMSLKVRLPDGAALEVGEEGMVPGEHVEVVVEVEGYGLPAAYSGDPELEISWGRVGEEERGPSLQPLGWAEQPGETFARRAIARVEIPRGGFRVAFPVTLGPGENVVAARVVPRSDLGRYWRGVQLANPVRVHVDP